MSMKPRADRRTLQDDRAELEADPGQGSPLAEGEGAPLTQDDAANTDAESGTTTLLLGGAPVAIASEPDPAERGSSHDPMTARGDQPIND
jgi:hypothetical protein